MRVLKVFLVSLLLIYAICGCVFAQESYYSEYYIEQYESSGADKLIDALPKETRDYMESVGLSDIDFYAIFDVSPKSLLDLLFKIASGNIDAPLKGTIKVIGIIFLSAIVRSLFLSDNKLENVLNIVTGSVIAVFIFSPMAEVIVRGVTAISIGADFMFVLIPILAGIITTAGNPALALSYNSLTFAAAQAVSQISDSVVMPLSGVYMATGMISSISPELKLDGLSDIIKKSVFGTLSFAAAIFSTILSLKGIMAISSDNLISKGIKLAVNSAVPVVGGAISEAYSSIVGSLSLLKNAVGMFGIVAVSVINLPVILELLFWILGLKLTSVFASLLGDDKSCTLINVITSALTIINVMILFGAVIFIISTGIILSLRTSI